MEAPNLPIEGIAQIQPNKFAVWSEEVEHYPFHKDGNKIRFTEYQIALNGLHLGLLQMETTGDGQITSIDGIDLKEGVPDPGFSAEDWDQFATHLYLNGITRARRVEHPEGRKMFLQAL